jgi:hypothetical protein
MKKYVITVLVSVLLGMTLVAFAQTYEKASDSSVKVTQSVSTVYDVAKIKERIVDLNDYITLAEAQIIKYEEEITALNKLLDEAVKVGVKMDAVAEPK